LLSTSILSALGLFQAQRMMQPPETPSPISFFSSSASVHGSALGTAAKRLRQFRLAGAPSIGFVSSLYATLAYMTVAVDVEGDPKPYMFYIEEPSFGAGVELGTSCFNLGEGVGADESSDATLPHLQRLQKPHPGTPRSGLREFREKAKQSNRLGSFLNPHPNEGTTGESEAAMTFAPFFPGPTATPAPKKKTRTKTHTRSATLIEWTVKPASQFMLHALNKIVSQYPSWPPDSPVNTTEVDSYTTEAIRAVCKIIERAGMTYIPDFFLVSPEGYILRVDHAFDVRTQFISIAAVGNLVDVAGAGCSVTFAYDLFTSTINAAKVPGTQFALSRYSGGNETDPTTMEWALIAGKRLYDESDDQQQKDHLVQIIRGLEESTQLQHHECRVSNGSQGLRVALWAHPAKDLQCSAPIGSIEATVLQYFNLNNLNPFVPFVSPWTPAPTAVPTTLAPTTAEPTANPTTQSPPTPTPSGTTHSETPLPSTSTPETTTEVPSTPSPTSAPETQAPPTPGPTEVPVNKADIAVGVIGAIGGFCLLLAGGLFAWSKFKAAKEERLLQPTSENLGFY
jgi:hypothetical protein